MDQLLVIGLGTGCCGLPGLVEIMNVQASVQMSHQSRPLLPWKPRTDKSFIRPRLLDYFKRDALAVGDAASYYLPYVEEILSTFPDAKLVCLERDREELINTFAAWVDRFVEIPTNHWGRQPSGKWYHHPIWTQVFPQYDGIDDQREGLGRYWDEYHERSHNLANRYPDNFRVFDSHRALSTAEGVNEILEFLGIASNLRVIKTTVPETVSAPSSETQRDDAFCSDDPDQCVVLVPCNTQIVPACDAALKQLEERGYPVWRVSGYAAVDQARNQMATDALLKGFRETLWIDADVSFHPEAVEKLRSHKLPVSCAIYPQKGKRALASHVMPGTSRITFGEKGGLQEVMYTGTGFLHVRREVYETIQQDQQLPLCNEMFPRVVLPFFQPLLRTDATGTWYLAEDYAFCHRIRQAGFKIYADTSVRLWHHGMYAYSWEDAGKEPSRFDTFHFNMGGDNEKG